MTTVALNGYDAYVEEFGTGSPVVLVHGLGGTGTDIWKHQIADLAREFRVVAYDLRGSGQSETTPGPYTIDLLVDDLRALVEALSLGRVALAGHSMGGSVVLSYAARFPDDVREWLRATRWAAAPGVTEADLADVAAALTALGLLPSAFSPRSAIAPLPTV